MKREIIDGNTAAAKASYKLSEISFIYPITPSSPMAEFCDEMASRGEKNIFGDVVDMTEMQSEAGAIGALHGAALSGSISTTFTSSQGLLLMLPNMYKIAGEMLPCVVNVASRSIATHSLNIFCDHSDIMSARQTGFAMLGASNPQEAYDFAVASFLTSMKTRIPFMHFFDGFRTSHQIAVVNTFEDEELQKIYPHQEYKEYKERAMSPVHPKQYGTSESQDIFFQGREKSNLAYCNLSNALEETFESMKLIGAKEHHIMEYYGSQNAKYIIVCMASACDTVKAYIDASKNDEIGLVKINLYRPFDAHFFINLLPKSVEKIAVLDRTKEQGSLGEPLYLDILGAICESESSIKVIGGRYGLGGKEFSPNMVKAIHDNLKAKKSKNHFTIGIEDDVTNTSLSYDTTWHIVSKAKNFLFYGIGSDGTVSSAKNITKIIGNEKKYVQAYFMYDSKKSGGLTRSFVSYSNEEINKPYLENQNDIVICNNASYLSKYNVAKQVNENGILLINSKYKTTQDIETFVLNGIKKELAQKHIALYSIDANEIARQNNLQGKISTIMQMAFFEVANIMNPETAKQKTIESIKKSLAKKGEKVIEENINAINDIKSQIIKIDIEETWKDLQDEPVTKLDNKYYDEYLRPVLDLNGDELPVSKVNLYGENQTGTSKFEKRNVSNFIPKWISEKCIQCGKCTFVCPHAVLRAKLLTDEQIKNAPISFESKKNNLQKDLNFHLEVSPADCVACGLCERACPTGAIKLTEKNMTFDDIAKSYEFSTKLSGKIPNIPLSPVKTQFMEPYFEFSGACAGCGETPYIKLLTQLFGKQLVIANATGCSSIYGGSAPTCPYTKDQNGFGPAWANSLFEDNAEFGLGMQKSIKLKRENFKKYIETQYQNFKSEIQAVLKDWLENYNNFDKCQEIYFKIKNIYQNATQQNNEKFIKIEPAEEYLFDNLDQIIPKSTWLIGGDGWAYDIDFGGLDHVFASGEDINILVLDTELYSNTGGQASKSTPRGAVAKFATNGKKTNKKNLALSAMQHKNVYVAQVCLGANMAQTLNAFVEAKNHKGVSLIIAYAPCINHGINMSNNLELQTDAVKCGYWHLFRYNPDLTESGKNPMQIDSPKPSSDFKAHLLNERRFANYYEKNGDTTLFEEAKADKDEFYEILQTVKSMYENKM